MHESQARNIARSAETWNLRNLGLPFISPKYKLTNDSLGQKRKKHASKGRRSCTFHRCLHFGMVVESHPVAQPCSPQLPRFWPCRPCRSPCSFQPLHPGADAHEPFCDHRWSNVQSWPQTWVSRVWLWTTSNLWCFYYRKNEKRMSQLKILIGVFLVPWIQNFYP